MSRKRGNESLTKVSQPERLLQGDKIGLFAPGSPVDSEKFDIAKRQLKKIGFVPVVLSNPCRAPTSKAGLGGLFSPQSTVKRVDELHLLFKDKSVKAIFCARGGYGSAELLPHLDFNLIRENPKILLGFSDVTALLLAVLEKSKCCTFHGPNFTSLYSRISKRNHSATASEEILMNYLQGRRLNPFAGVKLKLLKKTRVECPSGILIGGNLSTITALLGTPWEPNFNNRILFLEEVNEKPHKIHRMLLQLKQANKLNKLRALVCGSFLANNSVGDEPIKNVPLFDKILLDVFSDIEVPVYVGAPIGHQDRNFVVPLGVRAELVGSSIEIKRRGVL